jgi:hypothetical protein
MTMRNVWKGLVVGGLTGVAAGVVLDAGARASKKAATIGGQVREHAPEAGRWLQGVTGKASDLVHDADVPDQLRDGAQRVLESDAAHRVARLSTDVIAAAKEAAPSKTG